jgi:hypothetical protein
MSPYRIPASVSQDDIERVDTKPVDKPIDWIVVFYPYRWIPALIASIVWVYHLVRFFLH